MKLQDLTVLVVDDFRTMRSVIKNILKQIDITNVLEAHNGAKALDVLHENAVDLILSDWNMPRMTGIDFLRAVRADGDLRELPFVMVTAEGMRENIVEAIQAGANGYIIKPFTPDQLREKIERIFEDAG
ncbi:MAG: two-component system, chemotaxis family, chemotaxis protein CheY [Desulfovibrionales bacterium]|jgi:two-component system chemotaxis response regulator CheY|nr:two-component system, chemotaxis family, chemotaxis protein CheY [Desulfovibrionales bacterium]